MLIRLLRRLLQRAHIWAASTPHNRFIHCGENVTICPYVQSNRPDRIRFGSHIYIGSYAFLSSRGGIMIEDGAIIGPFVAIYSANHRYEEAEAVPYDGISHFRPVRICENAWIGGHVVIAPGVTVGEGAIVAAGAVVVSDVLPLTVVGGNPAQVLKQRDSDQYHWHVKEGRIYRKLASRNQLEHIELLDFGYEWPECFDQVRRRVEFE